MACLLHLYQHCPIRIAAAEDRHDDAFAGLERFPAFGEGDGATGAARIAEVLDVGNELFFGQTQRLHYVAADAQVGLMRQHVIDVGGGKTVFVQNL